ncbi:MAG: hypothetical protein CMG55_03275 [Candidatus Marinimicrobia bacterium]|nr:hypothetical protein [Candidatus Neomarinimicrobiota bacterium]|tara:strand:- start:146 stop:2230 length:2085 start_codon:yes stop_codon:yes gene_type:complete
MYKKIILLIYFPFSLLIAAVRVPHTELYKENNIWYHIGNNSPFNGVSYKLSNNSNTVIQQINYIDGIEWGKYYEWWSNGVKKVDGTYRSGVMHGRWKFFNENGKIYCAGSYMNGTGHQPPGLIKNIPQNGIRGLWTYWDKSGRKIEEGYFSKNSISKGNWSYWDKSGRKRLGKKINYNTFMNTDAIKHLDGYFLVSGPVNGLNKVYTQAHGSIRRGNLNGLWTYWDNDGNLLETKNYDYGIPMGQFIKYHPKGFKLIEGYVNGLDQDGKMIKEGKWYFWSNEGILHEEVEFVNGLRDGLTKYYSITGKQSAEIVYYNDQPWSGDWIVWYEDGSKKELGYYDEGLKNGSWKGWYKNGQKKYVLHYQGSVKHGVYTEWTEDGRLTKDIQYDYDTPVSEYLVNYYGDGYIEINRRNGKLSGSWIKWYSNGKKAEEGIYKNGKKGGIWNGWYKNGQKQYSGKYIDDQLDGLYTELDTSGRVIKEITYRNGDISLEYHIVRKNNEVTEFQKRNGILDGKWTRIYKNGNKAEDGKYKNGVRNGEWKGWFMSGDISYSCFYKNGNKSGLYQEWNLYGEIVKEIQYENGKRIQEYLLVKDGKGFMEINKKDGFLNGPWTKWYAPGKKEEVGEYKDGIKVGTWSRYNLAGNIFEEFNYDNQGRNLYEITYYKNGTVKQYRDYFSKTVQEYNIDGSKKGDYSPF